MLVKLNKSIFKYLLFELGKEKSKLIPMLSYRVKDNKFLLNIDEGVADDIRDWAGEKFQKVGFDQDYNITTEGEFLEEIIDIFYIK